MVPTWTVARSSSTKHALVKNEVVAVVAATVVVAAVEAVVAAAEVAAVATVVAADAIVTNQFPQGT